MIKVLKPLVYPDSYILLSGGVDSVAVCHFLNRGKRKHKALHFNHNLRPQNNLMQSKAEDLCEMLGVDLTVIHCKTKLKTESEYRNFRLDAMKKLDGNFITAHHLNDCVESYLMSVFKGNPKLQAIPFVTDIVNGSRKASIIHPFLLTSKDDLLYYVNKNELHNFVVHDETNTDNKMQRNWVRNAVIPLLAERQEIGLEKILYKHMLSTSSVYR